RRGRQRYENPSFAEIAKLSVDLFRHQYRIKSSSQPREVRIMTHRSTPHAKPTSDSGIRRRKRQKKLNDAVIAAFIGAAATIIVAFLGFPPLIQLAQAKWFPTLTSTVAVSATPTDTFTPSATCTETPYASVTPFPSETVVQVVTETISIPPTSTETSTSTSTPVPPKMVIETWANRYAGAVPLTVQFRVKESYVLFPDGSRSYCSLSACSYEWSVFFATSNKMVTTPQPWQDTFGFTFTNVGLYHVVVRVCQGKICGEAVIPIEGRP
ncbi:MAG: hypothetical protein ACOY0R_02445, partial [Chloroflexota bacterium]